MVKSRFLAGKANRPFASGTFTKFNSSGVRGQHIAIVRYGANEYLLSERILTLSRSSVYDQYDPSNQPGTLRFKFARFFRGSHGF